MRSDVEKEKSDFSRTNQMLEKRTSWKKEPLVDRNKIVLSPFHIKSGLVKQFVKAVIKQGGFWKLDKQVNCFNYICGAFPGLSDEKVKAGIFSRTKIEKLIKDSNFVISCNAFF